MRSYVGLDVSQATTAICVVDEDGRTLTEGKVPICPRAIAALVRTQAPELIRIGLECRTARGLALRRAPAGQAARDLPRYRYVATGRAMMANRTGRDHAANLARIVRAGW